MDKVNGVEWTGNEWNTGVPDAFERLKQLNPQGVWSVPRPPDFVLEGAVGHVPLQAPAAPLPASAVEANPTQKNAETSPPKPKLPETVSPVTPPLSAELSRDTPTPGFDAPQNMGLETPESASLDNDHAANPEPTPPAASATSVAVPGTTPPPLAPPAQKTTEAQRSQRNSAISSARHEADARDRELNEIRRQQKENDKRQASLQHEAAHLPHLELSPIDYHIRRAAIELDLRITRARAVGLSKAQLGSRDRLRASREKLGNLEEQEIASRSRSENVPRSFTRAMLSAEAGRPVGNRRETYRADHPSPMTPQAFLRTVDAADRAIADTSQNDGGDSGDATAATTARTLQNLGMLPGDIRRRVKQGELSVEQGRDLQERYWQLKPATTADILPTEGGFAGWLLATGKTAEYETAANGRIQDTGKLEELRNHYVNEFAALNHDRIDFDWAGFDRAREAFVSRNSRSLSRGIRYAGGTVKNLTASMAGMLSQVGGWLSRTAVESTGVSRLLKEYVGVDVLENPALLSDEEIEFIKGQSIDWLRNANRFAKDTFNSDAAINLRTALGELREGIRDGLPPSYEANLVQRIAEHAARLFNDGMGSGDAVAQFDVTREPGLQNLLEGFRDSGDPAMWEALEARLATSVRGREIKEQIAGYVARNAGDDPSSWASAFFNARVSGAQEILAEILLTAVTSGAAKALRSLRTTAMRSSLAGVRKAGTALDAGAAVVNRGKALLSRASLVGKAGAERLGRMGRAWNAAVRGAKAWTAEGLGEAAEEVLVGLGEANASASSLLGNAVDGFLGSRIMAAAKGAAGATVDAFRRYAGPGAPSDAAAHAQGAQQGETLPVDQTSVIGAVPRGEGVGVSRPPVEAHVGESQPVPVQTVPEIGTATSQPSKSVINAPDEPLQIHKGADNRDSKSGHLGKSSGLDSDGLDFKRVQLAGSARSSGSAAAGIRVERESLPEAARRVSAEALSNIGALNRPPHSAKRPSLSLSHSRGANRVLDQHSIATDINSDARALNSDTSRDPAAVNNAVQQSPENTHASSAVPSTRAEWLGWVESIKDPRERALISAAMKTREGLPLTLGEQQALMTSKTADGQGYGTAALRSDGTKAFQLTPAGKAAIAVRAKSRSARLVLPPEKKPRKRRANQAENDEGTRILKQTVFSGAARRTISALGATVVKGTAPNGMEVSYTTEGDIILTVDPDAMSQRIAMKDPGNREAFVQSALSNMLKVIAGLQTVHEQWSASMQANPGRGQSFSEAVAEEYGRIADEMKKTIVDEKGATMADKIRVAFGSSQLDGLELAFAGMAEMVKLAREGIKPGGFLRKALLRILGVLKRALLQKATWSQPLQDAFEDINYVLNKVEGRRKTPPPARGTPYKVAVPLSPKPSNSPEVKNWEQLNGKVHYYSDGTWEYEDWEGNKVKYKDGFPDFTPFAIQTVEIEVLGDDSDMARADGEARKRGTPKGEENTWHHHQDMKTMMELPRKLHERFTHIGGASLKRAERESQKL